MKWVDRNVILKKSVPIMRLLMSTYQTAKGLLNQFFVWWCIATIFYYLILAARPGFTRLDIGIYPKKLNVINLNTFSANFPSIQRLTKSGSFHTLPWLFHKCNVACVTRGRFTFLRIKVFSNRFGSFGGYSMQKNLFFSFYNISIIKIIYVTCRTSWR